MFKISPSRGSDVLLEVLGREFDGLLGCDYFSVAGPNERNDVAAGHPDIVKTLASLIERQSGPKKKGGGKAGKAGKRQAAVRE